MPLGRKADQVCDALTRRIQGLPDQAMRTLTWDQGREMARHQRLTPGTGVEVFFAHPHSPWERGTNENTNRLIRRYLLKGTPHHQPPALPRRHRRRAGQLPQSHPRLPHPHRSIRPTHCYHPLTPPTEDLDPYPATTRPPPPTTSTPSNAKSPQKHVQGPGGIDAVLHGAHIQDDSDNSCRHWPITTHMHPGL
nr:IS30 family transposase [Actinomyces sp.]